MALADLVKNRVNAKRKGNPLVGQLDEYLLKRSGDDRRDGRFHPSDLSGDFCARQWVLYNHHPDGKAIRDRSWSPRLKRVLDNGTYSHSRLQRYFQHMGILWGRWRMLVGWVWVEEAGEYQPQYTYREGYAPRDRKGNIDPRWEFDEISIQHDPLNIIGHTDGGMLLDGRKEAAEIKTINSRGFKWLAGQPKDWHREQGLIYLGCLEWKREQKALGEFGGFIDEFDERPWDGVRFVYEQKDDQELAEFYVEWDKDEFDAIIKPKAGAMMEARIWEMEDPLPTCTCGDGSRKSPLCKKIKSF